ncbi:hypothetical protein EDD16DRAFT_1516970 [Pisolithus croceorrhizus]|nr:hypothetical protein EDD16DRAFT_1516970 [Pisolithus croceorrhizus]KAI6154399.1 hypothetical protein EDD17DRAFT_1512918 [Pisolithus thermaeus]
MSECTSYWILKLWQEIGMSCKKLKSIAMERNEELQAEFIAWMAQYDPANLGFIDKKGRGANKKQVFISGHCTSTAALLTLNGIVVGSVVEGSMMHSRFMEWLEHNVICPYLSSYLISD